MGLDCFSDFNDFGLGEELISYNQVEGIKSSSTAARYGV